MNKRLFRIAWEGLKGRKSQTAVLVVLLTLSFAFIVLTLSITDSFTATEQEAGYDAYGQWNIAVSASDLSKKEAQQQDWIKAVASLQILGNITDEAGNVVTTLGAGEKEWFRMGRITVSAGRLPEAPGEIAMEMDVLSSLGYSYELGQTITLDQSYTLTGILTEYSDLWVKSDISYPGALIAWSSDGPDPDRGETWLFIQTDESYAQINILLKNAPYTRNYMAYRTTAGKADKQLYVFIIMVTTVLVIMLIYGMQMRQELKSVQLMREIGATSSQLAWILWWKTVIISIPALLLGTGLGALSLYGLIRLVEAGLTEHVFLSIPLALIGKAFGIWVMLVFLSMLLVQKIVMKGSLVEMKNMVVPVHLGIILIIAVIFSTSLFMVLEIGQCRTKLAGQDTADYMLQGVISQSELLELQKVQGVEQVIPQFRAIVQLSFEGWEEAEVRNEPLLGSQRSFPDGIGVYLQAFREPNPYLSGLLKQSGINETAFWKGNQVLLLFTYETEAEKPDCKLQKGDQMQLTSYAEGQWNGGELELLNVPRMIAAEELTLGGTAYINLSENRDYEWGAAHSYTIIAAYPVAQKLIKENQNNWLMAGTENAPDREVYMTNVQIYAGEHTDFYSTDYLISLIAKQWESELINNREQKAAEKQLVTERMLLLETISFCMVLITFLLLGTILYYSFFLQRRKYALLRSVGMSQEQVRNVLVKRFCLDILAASAIMGIGYLGKLLWDCQKIRAVDGAHTVSEVLRNLHESYFGQKAMGNITALFYLAVVFLLLAIYLLQARQVYRGNIIVNLHTEEEHS